MATTLVFEILEHRYSDRCIMLDMDDLRSWTAVTHETKDAVMAKIPRELLKQLGCDNPDIGVVSRKDDRIVLVPSQTARNTGKARRSKVQSEVRAGEVLGPDWRNKIYPHKFITGRHILDAVLQSNATAINERVTLKEAVSAGEVVEICYLPQTPKMARRFGIVVFTLEENVEPIELDEDLISKQVESN